MKKVTNIFPQSARVIFLFCMTGILFFMGCDSESRRSEAVNEVLEEVKNKYAPDKRVAIFDIAVDDINEALILKGETNVPEAKQALLKQLEEQGVHYVDSIQTLPSSELGNKIYGIIKISVANIRSAPRHSAELSTQATLGTPLKVFKKRGSWYLVQTPDDYISWIDAGGVQLMNEKDYNKWLSLEKIVYTRPFGFAREQQEEKALPVSDLVMGDLLSLVSEDKNFYKVVWPDGREGFVNKEEAVPYKEWLESINLSGESLVAFSKTMMGIPYLWGGTSFKGVDCSGFTKTLYFMHGMVIPRDASQQIHTGDLIDSVRDFTNLKKGDLLFFGRKATDSTAERVVHVGMWIGGNEFIHSAGRVHISSVDKEAENYDEYNYNRYLRTKRILNSTQGDLLHLKNVSL